VLYLFWIPVALIFHSYVLYPSILWLLAIWHPNNKHTYATSDSLPIVTILMAVYNEEAVIHKKIESIFNTTYPLKKLQVIVGSDSSTDRTDQILTQLSKEHASLHFLKFQRRGKSNTINELVDMAAGEIIISTDANVIFDTNTIFELVKHFKNPTIGLVDSRVSNTGVIKSGISIPESTYINREVHIKNREGRVWGSMMGPFGGCFAIRKSCYKKVPPTFLVDDFFICMKVIEQKLSTINSMDAIVYEDVSNYIDEEFRRKVRISIGAFQNLWHFKRLLWPPYKGRSFAFLSHKVIRWFGPFLIALALGANMVLAMQSNFYQILLILFLASFLISLIDFLLKRINIHITFVRFITHFYGMNLALLLGFFKFVKGVKSNVWQPTQRNQ
jgi:Glycosyltransferases, probably involved in cell wall biogenesis